MIAGVTHFTGGVQAPSLVTTTIGKNVFGSGLLTEALPNTYSSYGGVVHVPEYDVSSHVPSILYSPRFNSFDTVSTGHSSLNPVASDNQGLNLDVPLPLSFKLQVSKNVPNTYSFPQPVEFPTTYHVPHSLTHVVHHTQPVNTLYSSPSISSVESLSPAQHISSVETLTPLGSAHTVNTFSPVHSVETLSPAHLVHTVESVKSVETTPIQHTVHSVQSVPSVKTVGTLTPVEHSVHPVQSLETVSTVRPLEPVEAVTLPPLKSVEIVSPSQPVESYHTVSEVVKTNTPVVQSHVQTQKGPISDFFQNLNISLPSFPSLPSLPSFPSTSSFFTFTNSPVSSTTAIPLVETSTPSSSFLPSAYSQESVNIDTSLLHNDNLVKSVTSSNEYVQPTDAKGGYIY